MNKSIKKVIASFLAALMIIFAMPFSAMAYGANETPNFGLIFNAFTFNNKYFNYTQNATALTNRGVKDMPLQYVSTGDTTGQLWARKSIADTAKFTADSGATTANRRYTESGDRQLVNGDYFTMSVTVENIATVFSWGVNLQYTGVEPATVYKYTYEDPESGDPISYLTLIAKDDNTALQATVEDLGLDYENDVTYEDFAPEGLPITSISSGSTYFKNQRNFDVGGSTYESWGIAAGGASNDDYTDLTACPTQGSGVNTYKNPETGAPSYDFSYRVPMVTYLFKVTDANNIKFSLYQSNDIPNPIYYTSDFDHISKNDTYTYAPSYDDVTGEEIADHSRTINFQGQNEYNQSATYPTVTINTPDGYQNLSYTADASTTTYAVPNLADYTKQPDATNHYAAQWKDNNVPSGTFGNSDETFEIEFAATAHTFQDVINPAATCTTKGTVTHTCSTCNYSYQSDDPINPNAHNWGAWTIDDASWVTNTDNQVEANNSATATVTRVCSYNAAHTQTENATVAVTAYTASTEQAGGSVTFTATYGGETVGTKTVNFEALPHTHVWTAEKVATGVRQEATCVAAGYYEVAYQCTVCNEFDDASKENVNIPIDATAHPAAAVENRAKEDATCTEAGHEAGTYCTACNTWVTGGTAIPAKNHDFSGAIDITWAETDQQGAGKWTATGVQHCTRCTATTDVNVAVDYSHKDATKQEAGYDKWEAKVDGTVVDSKTEEIAAVKVTVTVGAADLGTVVGDIPSTGAEASKEFAFGTKFNVQAVPTEGATFVGWEMNGKIVSQSDKYSGVAYTDTFITPIYQEAAGDNINVYFYDKYGNIIKEFKDVTVADYQAAVANEVPQGLDLPGYTFAGYEGVTDDDIKNNAVSNTYWAVYEKNEAALYTVVTGEGVTIDAPAGTVQDNMLVDVPYDTKVTLTSDSAQAWTINDEVVAYGSSYSFYVGSNVFVYPAANAEVKTNVAIVGVSHNAPSHTVLATRTAGNATIVERGWIYGRYNGTVDMDEFTDLFIDIDKAGASNLVRVKRGPVTSSEQFSLTFKASQAGEIMVAAFVVDSNGNVTYSPIEDIDV